MTDDRAINRTATALAACVLLSLLCTGGALASDTDVAVEWINKFPDLSGASRLYFRDNCAEGFYDELTSHGWSGRFCFGNDDAWEDDFKDPSNSGNDDDYVDGRDIVMIATHGNPDCFVFNSSHDDQYLYSSEAIWGDDTDLEWIVLDACGCLENGEHVDWHSAYSKLHTICGFDTNAHDKPNRGEKFAQKLLSSYTVVQAWYYACEATEGSGTDCATMGVYRPHNTRGDYIWGEGSVADDSSSPTAFWYNSHNCD